MRPPKPSDEKCTSSRSTLLARGKLFVGWPNLSFCYESTHAAIPNVPGLEAAQPFTHVEIGGGYSGVELAQAYRRFSSDVTIIESGPQLLAREDVDVSQEMRRILSSGGITNKLITGTESYKEAS